MKNENLNKIPCVLDALGLKVAELAQLLSKTRSAIYLAIKNDQKLTTDEVVTVCHRLSDRLIKQSTEDITNRLTKISGYAKMVIDNLRRE